MPFTRQSISYFFRLKIRGANISLSRIQPAWSIFSLSQRAQMIGIALETRMKDVQSPTRTLRVIVSTLALIVFTLASTSAFAQNAKPKTHDYWLARVDPVVQADRKVADPADYMDLFRPDMPWSSAAQLKGFKISTQMVFRGTDEQLKAIIDGLKARHIGMSIELGLLVWSDTPPSCGEGSEGIGHAAGPGRPRLDMAPW
jgi:hypothetical protein